MVQFRRLILYEKILLFRQAEEVRYSSLVVFFRYIVFSSLFNSFIVSLRAKSKDLFLIFDFDGYHLGSDFGAILKFLITNYSALFVP